LIFVTLLQVMAVIDASEQCNEKPKKKKKKKKKAAVLGGAGENEQNMQLSQQQQQQQQQMEQLNNKDFGSSNLLEVAARFGLGDLRLPGAGASASDLERGYSDNGGAVGSGGNQQSKESKNSFHNGSGHGRGGAGGSSRGVENLSTAATGDEMKPSWDPSMLLGALPSQQQMHLFYQSLARSHGDGAGTPMGVSAAAPCNLSSNGGGTNDIIGGASSSVNNLRQSAFCHDRGPMSAPPDHSFLMNGSAGPVPMRYLPSVDNSPSRHVNPMLFSPRSASRNLGHFGAPDMNMPAEAAMLSQYIQSQQRFAPPVWGFANPNYHNY